MQLRDILGCTPVKLDRYGIEIEVEFATTYPTSNIQGWSVTGDGSLRGPSAEYISRVPRLRETLAKDLPRLVDALRPHTLQISDRCGVHIHMNVQNMKIHSLFALLVAYYTLEDLLVEYLSPERKANVFCMRASDAEFIIEDLVKSAENPKRLARMGGNTFKYSAMNIETISRFGTLEFRALSTPVKLEEFSSILEVVEIFHNLKMASKSFNKPSEVVEMFSGDSLEAFTFHFLPDIAQSIIRLPTFEDSIFEGMRRAQEIAYSFRPVTELPKKKVRSANDFWIDPPPLNGENF